MDDGTDEGTDNNGAQPGGISPESVADAPVRLRHEAKTLLRGVKAGEELLGIDGDLGKRPAGGAPEPPSDVMLRARLAPPAAVEESTPDERFAYRQADGSVPEIELQVVMKQDLLTTGSDDPDL